MARLSLLLLVLLWCCAGADAAAAAVPRSLGQSLSLRAAAAAQRHARHQPGGGHPPDERVTAVLNTFKRPDMLRRAVEHYTQCDVVDAVRVVWTEGGTPPATDGWRIGGAAGVDGAPRVQFDVLPDSLNSRFTPLPALRTRAIFAVDDDASCDDLALALEAWRNAERTLVGFYPRLHVWRRGRLQYHSWWYVWWHGEYSIVLTKAALPPPTPSSSPSIGLTG
ncbi:hypothetical protein EMIHUDRAFT_471678, partial [Emiliania huxleyi CCMP1516]|uniref:Glycosyl transferase 64 domain-containing protein n=2 Tax=Emiliania huxleyi TaxID=2903 RepID=A0A0D3JWM3_EMIH1